MNEKPVCSECGEVADYSTLVCDGCVRKAGATGMRLDPKTLLPTNPTQLDYLHAIRAITARTGPKQIFDLADAGMFAGDGPTKKD